MTDLEKALLALPRAPYPMSALGPLVWTHAGVETAPNVVAVHTELVDQWPGQVRVNGKGEVFLVAGEVGKIIGRVVYRLCWYCPESASYIAERYV